MDKIFRTYTMVEALRLLHELCQVPYKAKRSWKSLFAYIETLDAETKQRIRQSAGARTGSKRSANDDSSSERTQKRPRLTEHEERHDGLWAPANEIPQTVDDLVNGPFLATQTDTIVEDCISRFIDRTNNDSTRKKICVVCARKMSADQYFQLLLRDIPNTHVLKPSHPHEHHGLIEGSLFHTTVSTEESNDVCKTCLRYLTKCSRPKISLANNMWIGPVPFQLAILTLPEQLLISLNYPAAYILKIYPKNVNPKRQTDDGSGPPVASEKLRGNVSSFRLPTSEIANMVAGNIVPRPSLILAAVIGVTFVGVDKSGMDAVDGLFRVRRQRVFDALMWLKRHNSLYSQVEISQDNLRSLPEDGIPQEITENVKFSSDLDAVAREHAGYVPGANGNDDEEDGDGGEQIDSMDVDLDEYSQSFVDEGNIPEALVNEATTEEHSAVQQRGTNDPEPQVFPLQSHGVVDVGGDNIPDTTLFAHAVENIVPTLFAQDYGVRKGRAFVNEYGRLDDNKERFDGGPTNPNHLLGAFPILFPYGLGGLEVDRVDKVSYEEHVKWALQYADDRFRKNTLFAFQAFGVLWKRQICRSASLQIDRNLFLANQTAFQRLKPEDLVQASEEELKGKPISNPAIRLLRKHIKTIRARVQGTDESRIGIRAQIWGMNLRFNPPTIWATINLSDTGDPIAQVLAGQDIDLDNFVAKTGPNATLRGKIIGADPFAAAEYFHLVVRVILEEMMGISVGTHGAINRREGILGIVNAYIGTVEAQARGSLHLHILFWLKDAPHARLMQDALQSPSFRDKIKQFIKANIRADVTGDILPQQNRTKLHSSIPYSRPEDPRKPNYKEKARKREDRDAAVLQCHECTVFYCLKIYKGKYACKRGYPWPTYPDDWVDANGNWGAKRRYPFINPWNPPIFRVTRSNMDFKLMTNARETKDIAFYITLYIAKRQVQAANVSAILSSSRAFKETEEEKSSRSKTLRDLNKRLLAQCANTLSRQYELSGPEVMSYLMGWGDRYISHTFIKIYWDVMVSALYKHSPELKSQSAGSVDRPTASSTENDSQASSMALENGKLVLQDQLSQYADRGEYLENMNIYDYFTQTYHTSDYTDEDESETIDDPHAPAKRGRPARERIPYMPDCGREGARIIRGEKQETALHIVGRWLPADNDPNRENYAAQVLMLLKPWRELSDLKDEHGSYELALEDFVSRSPFRIKRIMENLQYFHDSSGQAQKNKNDEDAAVTSDADEDDMMDGECFFPAIASTLTEDDVTLARHNKHLTADHKYGVEAMRVAQKAGIFTQTGVAAQETTIANVASLEETNLYTEWEGKVAAITRKPASLSKAPIGGLPGDVDIGSVDVDVGEPGDAIESNGSIECLANDDNRVRTDQQQASLDLLNTEQRRAHTIIEKHLRNAILGVQQAQLLMIVQGEGGTGKTVLLNAVSHTFDFLNATSRLAKTGTTGISASLINGQTLHQWAGIPIRGGNNENWVTSASKKIQERRLQNILPVQYLIIDEFSMLTKKTFAQLSQILGHVKATMGEAPPSRPFGNINVILCGDPHQFPPVGNPKAALYNPNSDTTLLSQLGLAFYQQFDTVITLTEQNRVTDPRWSAFLKRLRHGRCTEDDINMVRGLLVTAPGAKVDWVQDPWKDAVLVTPRHSCRILWNSASLLRHRTVTGNPIYISNAEDKATRTRRNLTLQERVIVAGMSDKQTGKLQEQVEVALGMRAMVLWNISTEADLANGTRGTIVDIRLDMREQQPLNRDSEGRYLLSYPPAVLLIRIDHYSFPPFEGLPPGVLPITPTTASFSIKSSNEHSVSIKRRQYALTPGYAFTDYKSQGQTIPFVVVDLQNPPRGGLTPFNAYVALSRSRGRDTIRILRGFDVELFTTHPSEVLREEDKRLDWLTRQTRERFPMDSPISII